MKWAPCLWLSLLWGTASHHATRLALHLDFHLSASRVLAATLPSFELPISPSLALSLLHLTLCLQIELRTLCMLGKSYSPSLFALTVHTRLHFLYDSSISCMFLARAPFIVNLTFLINNKWMVNIIMNAVLGWTAVLSYPSLRTRLCLLQVRLDRDQGRCCLRTPAQINHSESRL